MTALRRLSALLLSLVLVLSLTACEQKDDSPLAPYDIPWEKDAIAEAVKAGELHYYFMSNEGWSFSYQSEREGIQETDRWGDSTLLIFPNGQTMLIDAGLDGFAPLLLRSLERLGIETLDYLVFSHPHNDHCYGGVCEGGVLDSLAVGQVYYNGTYNSNWEDPHAVENACARAGVPCTVLQKGDTVTIGEVNMEVLWPQSEIIGQTNSNIDTVNDTSLVLRFDYGQHSSLFTGDIYIPSEMTLAAQQSEKVDVDLLKLPHHGEESSNSGIFAEAVSPELAVCPGNVPMEAIIYRRYTSQGSKVLADGLDGYIFIAAGADGAMEYETAHPRTTDYYDKFDKKS